MFLINHVPMSFLVMALQAATGLVASTVSQGAQGPASSGLKAIPHHSQMLSSTLLLSAFTSNLEA